MRVCGLGHVAAKFYGAFKFPIVANTRIRDELNGANRFLDRGTCSIDSIMEFVTVGPQQWGHRQVQLDSDKDIEHDRGGDDGLRNVNPVGAGNNPFAPIDAGLGPAHGAHALDAAPRAFPAL